MFLNKKFLTASALTASSLFFLQQRSFYADQQTEPSVSPGLNPKEFQSYKLEAILPVSHDTKIFRFAFDNPEADLNMQVASCLVTRAIIDGKPIVRPYPPLNRPSVTNGHLALMVKEYPQGGVMSKHIHSLQVGDSLEMKGPILKYDYKPSTKREIGMIAGGTGITPMFQVIQEVLENQNDKTKISLVYANRSPSDILLKERLDEYSQQYPDRFKVYYTVDEAKNDPNWKGGVGYINAQVLKDHLPKPRQQGDESIVVFVCGTPGMMNYISGPKTPDYKQGETTGLLKQLGYNEKNVFKF